MLCRKCAFYEYKSGHLFSLTTSNFGTSYSSFGAWNLVWIGLQNIIRRALFGLLFGYFELCSDFRNARWSCIFFILCEITKLLRCSMIYSNLSELEM